MIGHIAKKLFSESDKNAQKSAAFMILHAVVGYLSRYQVSCAKNVLAAFDSSPSLDPQSYWDSHSLKYPKAKDSNNDVINLAQTLYFSVICGNESLFNYINKNYADSLRIIDNKIPDMCNNIHYLYFQSSAPPFMSMLGNIGNML